jgi:hypothetical protein
MKTHKVQRITHIFRRLTHFPKKNPLIKFLIFLFLISKIYRKFLNFPNFGGTHVSKKNPYFPEANPFSEEKPINKKFNVFMFL